MEPLSGLDATFLYMENATTYMHIGGVGVFEGSLAFENFRELMASRIHLFPKLRQRLVEVPLSIDYPYWVDDPHFNLDMHLQHLALPKPGSWRELRALASSVFSKPLDRSRPLWEFIFVEGLDNVSQVPAGSVAVISKIHHSVIDGVAGAGLFSILFDFTPNPPKLDPPQPFDPKPLPSELTLVRNSTMNFLSDPLKLPRLVTDAATATIKAGMLTRVQNVEPPTVPFTAPRTPLNGIISSQPKWNTAILSLDRVKKLKKVMGTTVNDVVLAICAGGLRRYLIEKNQLPNKPLVAMVPVSVRSNDENVKTGNQISNMLVQLATNIEDPIERLEIIHENAMRSKMYQGALGADTLSKVAEMVPFGLAHQAARIYSRFELSKLHNPVYNVVITNVPGPQFPMYMYGHKLLSYMGMGPVIDGMGMIITVLSYNGLITISPTSDSNSMPDIDLFSRYILEAANELEELVLAVEEERAGQEVEVTTAVSDALFEHVNQYFQDNPDFLRPDAGLFQFNIKNDAGKDIAHWILDCNTPPGSATKGKTDEADAVLNISDEHLMRIAKGEISVQIAFVQGRLQFTGDMNKALKLGAILGKIPPLE